MTTLRYSVGEYGFTITFRVVEADRVTPVVLTGYTVTFNMKNAAGDVVVDSAPCTIFDPINGIVKYVPTTVVFTAVGTFTASLVLTKDTSEQSETRPFTIIVTTSNTG